MISISQTFQFAPERVPTEQTVQIPPSATLRSALSRAIRGSEGNHAEQAPAQNEELFGWYWMQYAKKFSMTKGKDVGSRHVGPASDLDDQLELRHYRFNELYDEDAFRKYMSALENTSGDRLAAYSFLLHISVAFLLPPAELERLLSVYGFPALHVKNLFHLSLYAVLNELRNAQDRMERNPFQEIEALYKEALTIISSEKPETGGRAAYSSKQEREAFSWESTRAIRTYLFHEQDLTPWNMLTLVSRHSEVFDRQHHRLLAEHRKCVQLFSILYASRSRDGQMPAETEYSLHQFLSDFRKKQDPKHINEDLYQIILKKRRHPTREAMLILWLYSYCFLFQPDVYVPAGFGDSDPLEKYEEYLIHPGAAYEPMKCPFQDFIFHDDANTGGSDGLVEHFHIFEYLSDPYDPVSPLCDHSNEQPFEARDSFLGEEMIAYLNGRLRDYTWPQLDKRRGFDRTILCLSGFSISGCAGPRPEVTFCGQRVSYDRKEWKKLEGTIPFPLFLITKLLREIKAQAGKPDYFPLECSLYEYI